MNCIKLHNEKLTQKAKTLKLTNYSKLNKSELVFSYHGSPNGKRW